MNKEPRARSDDAFWRALEHLLATSRLVIDRPAGSSHPRYPDLTYPLDYGYLQNTQSMDGGGIDVWRGGDPSRGLTGVVVTVDLIKRDSEIKVLIQCTPQEMEITSAFHDDDQQRALLITRPDG